MSNRIFIAVLMVFIGGCASLQSNRNTTLYEALGSMDGIDKLVHEMLINFAGDSRIVERFRDVNIGRFKAGFVTYICDISGGPCQYAGESMRVIHAGHNYTQTEFNAVVESLVSAMEKQKLPVATQNRLLVLLAPHYKDVVYQ